MNTSKTIIQGIKSSIVLIVLGLLVSACHQEEASPEAFITLKNNEGYLFQDTTISAASPSGLFVLITGRKGKASLDYFSHTITFNDSLWTSESKKLVGGEREAFQFKYYSHLLPQSPEGKMVWEFYIVDETGKLTSTKLNIEVK